MLDTLHRVTNDYILNCIKDLLKIRKKKKVIIRVYLFLKVLKQELMYNTYMYRPNNL